jgi:hemolysin activation/secretion protein
MRQLTLPLMMGLALCATSGIAQNEKLLPKPVAPPAAATGKLTVDARDTILVKELKQVIFSKPDSKITPGNTDIEAPGIRLLQKDSFRKVLAPFIGKPLSLSTLDAISRAVVTYYRDKGYPLVDVIAPAGQDITDGVVRFVVVEGKLGKVEARGNKHFSNERITGAIGTQPGEPLYAEKMRSDLDWLNRNPFRNVDLLYRRGDEAGETDVILQTVDRKPWRVYAGIDDTGTDLTGNQRLFSGLNMGDLFGADHRLNYQYTRSVEGARMQGHALSYTAPLPWRHELGGFATFQEVKPDLAPPFNSDGHALELGLRYTVPLPSFADSRHDVTLGYDFKRSDNNLDFGGTRVFNTDIDVSQFNVAYNHTKADAWGETSLAATGYFSPGDATDSNSDTAFSNARAASSADYMYGTLRVERRTLLPAEFSLITTFEGQLASARLPGSEQMLAGGYSTVRGYREGQASGDNGILFRNELRLPAFSLSDHNVDAMQIFLFADYGWVDINDRQAGEDGGAALLSVGPGLRYRLADMLDFRADYGIQTRRASGMNKADRGQRIHFALTLSY